MRDPAKRDEGRVDATEWNREELEVSIGGLRSETGEHVIWAVPELEIGDEIRIRVLGPGLIDEPK